MATKKVSKKSTAKKIVRHTKSKVAKTKHSKKECKLTIFCKKNYRLIATIIIVIISLFVILCIISNYGSKYDYVVPEPTDDLLAPLIESTSLITWMDEPLSTRDGFGITYFAVYNDDEQDYEFDITGNCMKLGEEESSSKGHSVELKAEVPAKSSEVLPLVVFSGDVPEDNLGQYYCGIKAYNGDSLYAEKFIIVTVN